MTVQNPQAQQPLVQSNGLPTTEHLLFLLSLVTAANTGGSGSAAWGGITGTLSAQTDLQTALNAKQPLATVLTNTTASYTVAESAKLAGIAAGATVNSTDAFLLARANHTGTQAVGTITGLAAIATSGSAADLSAGTLPAARFDDTAHGARAGGTLHPAVVAAGASGFMTGADKTKLDAVAAVTVGNAVVNFGAFPGASDASVTITGQAAILAGAKIAANIVATATADHSADEHWVENLTCVAGNIVPGTGFTIYMKNDTPIGDTLIYGQWSVAWQWAA